MSLSMQSLSNFRLLFLTLLLAVAVACSNEETLQGLEVVDVESYWTVRGKLEDETYIRPVVRFRIHNTGAEPVDYIQTMAVFRRASAPEESWGSAFEYSLSGDPVPPGGTSRLITLRSDSYYFSKQQPDQMFDNEKWEQVTVEVFVKVGPSSWKPVAKMEVPKQLGAPGLEKFLTPEEESDEPPVDPAAGS
jgi:hypothetical protein